MAKTVKPDWTAAQKKRVAEEGWKESVWYAHSGALEEEQKRWETFFVAALSSGYTGHGRFPQLPQPIVEMAQDIVDDAMKLVKLREKVKWEECLAEARKNRGK